jgi:uncharacterized membrane-anchored protein
MNISEKNISIIKLLIVVAVCMLLAGYGFSLAKSGSAFGVMLTVVSIVVGGIVTVIIRFKERQANQSPESDA